MNILFCGKINLKLIKLIENTGDTIIDRTPITSKVDINMLTFLKPDWIVSYNYRHIFSKDIINFMNENIVNLHISFLPWNRGSHPNLWSAVESTPSGVTIHRIDPGIDTGDIFVQEKIFLELNETLKSSYDLLHERIQELFHLNWLSIKNKKLLPKKQKGVGSIHYKKDFGLLKDCMRTGKLKTGWNTTIKEFRDNYLVDPVVKRLGITDEVLV